MRLSQLVGNRYKERPAEATLDSHALLLRGGYVRQVANGIYSLLPPGLRVARKIEGIIREEMNRIGGQEVLMPVVLPRELWDESGRYDSVGTELARFPDRTGHDMLLAMTHEEAVVNLCRGETSSYAQLPFMVYQIQTKFRDELRSRGGLIRVREFTMKDAYSFHASQDDLRAYYDVCMNAYRRIFARVGLPEVAVVESDPGMMGGLAAHEFILLTDVGEDTIAVCDTCSYRANFEVAKSRPEAYPEEPKPLEKVHTPGKKTIEEVAAFLGIEPRQTVKAVFYDADNQGKLVMVLIRGDLDVNEAKIARHIQREPAPAEEIRIVAAGAVPGYATAIGLDRTTCTILADHSVAESDNLVCGANEVDYHMRNFNLERDLPGVTPMDVAQVRDGDACPVCEGRLWLRRGIEVGNIFQLGTKYTEAMAMTYTDENGETCIPIMGCYGIGVGRLISAVIEIHHDDYGPKWPVSIAPWQVHVNALNLAASGVKDVAETLYTQLTDAGVETLYDDRDCRAGFQFADADLLGAPFRVIVSERNLKKDQLEWKRRDTGDTGAMPLENAAHTIAGWVKEVLENPQSRREESAQQTTA
ncbi:MAG TPA: proline--tRNA ligase [Candidatus Hydrogenedentes bacterium]|nr:proline--tRNA ligase [Candidatus Hydrogenedentota bacterium]HIJ73117.1 proline--tRNA ligase [Candidatus Hydrogenedentota bacterium]